MYVKGSDSIKIVHIFLSLKMIFVYYKANSVDPDEIPHYAFYLGLHYLPK